MKGDWLAEDRQVNMWRRMDRALLFFVVLVNVVGILLAMDQAEDTSDLIEQQEESVEEAREYQKEMSDRMDRIEDVIIDLGGCLEE